MCAVRMCSIMGMIWAEVGFLPGVWIWRRLQRALRYGISRVASSAWSSETVLGNGISAVSMTLGADFCFTAEDAEHAEETEEGSASGMSVEDVAVLSGRLRVRSAAAARAD